MSNGKTSPWVWVGIGCGVLVVGMAAFVAFIVFVVFASMRSATPYKDGLARAQADPRVIEALGAPIEPGWFLSGSISTSGRSGKCDIDIPLKGSKQNGSLHVVGSREGGRWTYSRMLLTPDKGDPIDVLEPPPSRAQFEETAPFPVRTAHGATRVSRAEWRRTATPAA